MSASGTALSTPETAMSDTGTAWSVSTITNSASETALSTTEQLCQLQE
jgi:hypothetical protein